jgi:hypothetical protein
VRRLLGHVLSGDYPYAREITLQVLLSGASLTIKHPGETRDDIAVYGGSRRALRAYGRGEIHANARLAALDDLILRRDRGGLVDYIAGLATELQAVKRTLDRGSSAPRLVWCWRSSLPVVWRMEHITTRRRRCFPRRADLRRVLHNRPRRPPLPRAGPIRATTS